MTRNGTANPRNVDEYLAGVPRDQRSALQKLRGIVKSVAPDAEEVISYGMPAFRHHGMLVYYASFKDHCSFFIGGPTTRSKFAAELRPYAAGKGTVHFTPEKPLPEELVRKIVKARVEENEAKERKRKSHSRHIRKQ